VIMFCRFAVSLITFCAVFGRAVTIRRHIAKQKRKITYQTIYSTPPLYFI
jgi:hypothetical protein